MFEDGEDEMLTKEERKRLEKFEKKNEKAQSNNYSNYSKQDANRNDWCFNNTTVLNYK